MMYWPRAAICVLCLVLFLEALKERIVDSCTFQFSAALGSTCNTSSIYWEAFGECRVDHVHVINNAARDASHCTCDVRPALAPCARF